MVKETSQSTSGTSFHNTTITTNVARLIELFPNSYSDQNNGENKVNYDFELETSTGEVFTIYDWKEYRPIDDYEQIQFHIGGFSREVTEQAKRELLKML
jgi:PKD repeat protein